MSKQITPVIKKTRVKAERYEVCPHCKQEIGEKGHYVDPEDYVYHRGCVEKGPIDKLKPVDMSKLFGFGHPVEVHKANSTGKTKVAWDEASDEKHQSYGTMTQVVEGVEYDFDWEVIAHADRADKAEVEQPNDMPDDVWDRNWESMEEAALQEYGKGLEKGDEPHHSYYTYRGTYEKNIAGVNYEFDWLAKLYFGENRQPDDIQVEQPGGMPDDIWQQVYESVSDEIGNVAHQTHQNAELARTAVGRDDRMASSNGNWLEKAMSSVEIGLSRVAQRDAESPSYESDDDFFTITIPLGNRTDIDLFTQVVNQGIDAHLEGFTQSNFKHGQGQFGENRLILDFHRSELPILTRRLREIGSEEAERLADDIESDEAYPSQFQIDSFSSIDELKKKKETLSELPSFDATDEELDALYRDSDHDVIASFQQAIKVSQTDLLSSLSESDRLAVTTGWDATNDRRLTLLEKHFNKTIAPQETAELKRLQELAGIARELEVRGTSRTAAKKKPIPMNPPKPAGKPMDDALLADGLGAFLDVFVNYHSGKEGDKLTKWIMGLLQDPRFAAIAGKLEQFHNLIREIYSGVLEIAKYDAKVASILSGKTLKISQSQYITPPVGRTMPKDIGDIAFSNSRTPEDEQKYRTWMDASLKEDYDIRVQNLRNAMQDALRILTSGQDKEVRKNIGIPRYPNSPALQAYRDKIRAMARQMLQRLEDGKRAGAEMPSKVG